MENHIHKLDMCISVVMPAYNAEKTIGAAIDSVIKQTYSALELIVINDASTDHTLEILQHYLKKDHRIRLISNENNLGVSISRNIGVQSAKYEWIAFLDSDDIWNLDKLKKQINQLKLFPKNILFFTGSTFIDEYGRKYNYELHVPNRISYKELLKQNIISCSSVLIRKDMLLKYPMHNNSEIHEDFATWLKVLQEEQYAIGLDEPLLIYRISRNSKSGNKLHAAKMQWKTYQYIGVGKINMVTNFLSYAIRNFKKYKKIGMSTKSNEE